MIKKVTERSSAFVVVSRKTLISGMAGIAVLSFAFGYFLGYGGPSSEKMVRNVQADNKVVVSEEKTVLDSSGKPTIVMPPSTPDAIPKEPLTRPAEQNKAAAKPEESQKKTEAAVPAKVELKEVKKDVPGSQNKVEAAPAQTTQKPQDKMADKPQGTNKGRRTDFTPRQDKQAPAAEITKEKPEQIVAEPPPAKPKGKTKGKAKVHAKEKKHPGKSYALQVGSFQDARKARQLKERLDEKGYKSYIMIYSPSRGKIFSRVRIGSFGSKEEAEGIISELKEMGLEGIIVPGPK